jgi:hypothetical protein
MNGSVAEDDPVPVERVPRRDRRRRSRRWWPFVLLGVGVIVVMSLVLPSGRHQWAESLIRQPSHYSTLAFAAPTALPKTVVSGQPVKFTFTIGNQEGQDLVYGYRAKSSPTRITAYGGYFAVGSVAVPAGQSRLVTVSADPECTASPCRITVTLIGHPEMIDFLAELTGSGSSAGNS